jgi:hypothetical protein
MSAGVVVVVVVVVPLSTTAVHGVAEEVTNVVVVHLEHGDFHREFKRVARLIMI